MKARAAVEEEEGVAVRQPARRGCDSRWWQRICRRLIANKERAEARLHANEEQRRNCVTTCVAAGNEPLAMGSAGGGGFLSLAARLEEVVATAGGRCWDGKEQLARDQIRSRSSREVGHGKQLLLQMEPSAVAVATEARLRQREEEIGEATVAAIAEGWPQEKHDWADLAGKIDGREEAGNNTVSRGRGPQLLRLPGLQGHMRAATSAGCSSRMRQRGRQMTLPTEKGATLMVAAIDAGCCDWGDGKMVQLLMEEKAAGCSGRGEGGGSVQRKVVALVDDRS
ncbi:hypothetical protein BHM03_00033832 [Ensete ventricosum]|nr:hypothetical protein BHM03_00033832 [Ensete ventricosum]